MYGTSWSYFKWIKKKRGFKKKFLHGVTHIILILNLTSLGPYLIKAGSELQGDIPCS